ncbi:hypothetical protein [Piscinibacter terrae]|uniref:hypothetical protein n=1 Tax=Piscinibacter terrae TaxID=2496871 RepID=UPI001387433A|nr:hypothetical protein [Albitalea terrae]
MSKALLWALTIGGLVIIFFVAVPNIPVFGVPDRLKEPDQLREHLVSTLLPAAVVMVVGTALVTIGLPIVSERPS